MIAAPLLGQQWPYLAILLTEILIAALFAASLHFLTGLAGMTSFGHAAWFGLGAYGAALLLKLGALPMEAALLLGPLAAALGALVFGWFCVRLSGVYLAMLTLAVAQILWATAFQWDDVTGGSNGLTGLWPAAWLSSGPGYYYLTLALCALGVWWLRRLAFAPLGYALRGVRDSALRAEALGMDTRRVQWAGFVAASLAAGMAGSLYAFSRAASRPTRWPSAVRSTGWSWCCSAGCNRWPVRWPARRPIPGCRTQPRAAPNTGTRCWGWPSWPWSWRFPTGSPARRRAGPAGCRFGAPRNERPALLQVRDLRKSFGGIDALAGVSFTLQAGQMLALIGPNGAGKSTCFNALGGQVRPDTGSVRLDGRELVGLSAARICRLGVGRSFQTAAVFRSMTVLENVQTALLSRDRLVFHPWRRAGRHAVDEAMALLEQTQMAGKAGQACGELAYGDVKRVELAMALAHRPRLLLMDEPTAGMATNERHALMQLTRQLADTRGIAVLFTEHSLDVVFKHADRIAVLVRGSLLAEGEPAAIAADPRVQAAYLGTEAPAA